MERPWMASSKWIVDFGFRTRSSYGAIRYGTSAYENLRVFSDSTTRPGKDFGQSNHVPI